jgi:hypothetical protein
VCRVRAAGRPGDAGYADAEISLSQSSGIVSQLTGYLIRLISLTMRLVTAMPGRIPNIVARVYTQPWTQ